MHDLQLFIARDHIDRELLKNVFYFHSNTNNRDSNKFSVFPPNFTQLSEEQIRSMQFKEYEFGGEQIPCGDGVAVKRYPSAQKFKLHAHPLELRKFQKVLKLSFGENQARRSYPSGGALYSAQAIVYARNIESIVPSAYHYLPKTNSLERLTSLNCQEISRYLFLNKDYSQLENYDFFVLYVILIEKVLAKYGARGYRLALLEVGSMYQSLIGELEIEGLRSRIWGGFEDETLAAALGIDPRVAWPVVTQIVGRETI